MDQEYYQFIQKTTDDSDPRYDSYISNLSSYIVSIIWLGNSIVILLFTLIKNNKMVSPGHGMLGTLIDAKEYRELWKKVISHDLKEKILKFNSALNQVKHSLPSLGDPDRVDIHAMPFFDFKDLQAKLVSGDDQNENIRLGQEIITELGRKLRSTDGESRFV